jgi:hypothetical protein
VDTFNSNLRLTATPLADLRLNASYAHNARENKTGTSAYPQVATDMFLGSGTRSNVPFSFTQDRFKLGADYRGLEGVKLSAGADWDWRSRPYHEVVTTRETTVWGKAGVQAGEKLNLAFKLAKAQRTHSAYGVSTWFGAAENPLLRKYNLAERQRDTAGVRADSRPPNGEPGPVGRLLQRRLCEVTGGPAKRPQREHRRRPDVRAVREDPAQPSRRVNVALRQAGSQTGPMPDWSALGTTAFTCWAWA